MNSQKKEKIIRELRELPPIKIEFVSIREIGGFPVHPCSSVFIRG